ncbi:Hypothetical protein R9X50_00520300 [Acrodontium crateriforme]|uniref:GP-PDE domain-containing protein n=1 Tax=Acrodontium crateriforme TaxID=150365 RepID=A0AAQ3RBB7_9PEZI|nr:Hypothetical protein R9X50_00520300 [Acrodontium crateriforme]
MSEAETEPLLRRASLAFPPMLVQPGIEKLATHVTLADHIAFPLPAVAHARLNGQKRKLPQCIAHRGYKAKFPENTLAAFRGAVAVGAHAIETDLHITKDEVVVISHDATLKRCFGRPDKIIDRNWDEIKDARTVAAPHEPMPRLIDLLVYLAAPRLEDIWLLLDIKLDNDADDIMRLIGSTIASVAPPETKPWTERIVLGAWAAKYLPLAQKYLPGFPIVHIGFSLPYARHFFTVPDVGFNMLLATLVAPGGRRFIQDAQEKYNRPVLAWTVNTKDKMQWCIRRNLDGVITDDPELYLSVCENHDDNEPEKLFPLNLRDYFDVIRVWAFVVVIFWLRRKKFMPIASRELISPINSRSP